MIKGFVARVSERASFFMCFHVRTVVLENSYVAKFSRLSHKMQLQIIVEEDEQSCFKIGGKVKGKTGKILSFK